jgi:quinol monooxygenase YgiN
LGFGDTLNVGEDRAADRSLDSCFRLSAIMIVNKTRITVMPDKRKEFFQTINQVLEPIRASTGCLSFNVYVDSTDENSALLVSEWETEDDLNLHLRSNDFAILHGAMAVLGTRIEESRAVILSGSRQIPNKPPFSMISIKETNSCR